MLSYEALLSRRSVRRYEQKSIPDEMLRQVLRAGMYAPSAMNSQPWEFIVVRAPSVLLSLSKLAPYWGMLPQAGAAIVVVANLANYRSSHQDFFIQDCSACTENMLIAAHGLGLGGVWLGLHPKTNLQEQVASLLDIPKAIVPFSVVSLGFPAETLPPHTSYKDEKVFFEAYGKK